MPLVELTKEAEAKVKTLVECLNLNDESSVINELFYQYMLDQETEERRTIMAVYQLNIKNSSNVISS
jgi:hypothetical protein